MSEKSSAYRSVAVIGAGNLGSAIAMALSRNYDVVAVRRDVSKISWLEEHGVTVGDDVADAADKADAVIICVKPRDVIPVLSEIRDVLGDKPVISFAAAVKLEEIARYCHKPVRAMTNIASKFGDSMVVYYSLFEDDGIHELLSALGRVWKVDNEELVDLSTVFLGSAPAFVSLLIQAFEYAGIKCGLNAELSREMAISTFASTSKLVESMSPDEVIKMIATPAGTTIEGLVKMKELGVEYSIIESLMAAVEKLKKM